MDPSLRERRRTSNGAAKARWARRVAEMSVAVLKLGVELGGGGGQETMDALVFERLKERGFDVGLGRRIPHVPVCLGGRGQVLPVGAEVSLLVDGGLETVRLRRISELFAGDRVPPDLERIPEAYVPFFATIELTAADYCSVTGSVPPDREFERLYRHLRRRPDGRHERRLFSYLQAAARLFMSLRDVSRAEFEAVARRLERSARTFAIGSLSRNYHRFALSRLLGAGGGASAARGRRGAGLDAFSVPGLARTEA